MDEPFREYLTGGVGCGAFVAAGGFLLSGVYVHSTGSRGFALFFPYTAWIGGDSLLLASIGGALAILQWPAYGVLAAVALAGRARLSWLAAMAGLVAIVAHAVAYGIAVGDGW